MNRIALGIGGLVLGGLVVARAAGLRFNATSSMPTGLWHLAEAAGALRPGAIVVVCPPDNAVVKAGVARGYIGPGSCPGGFQPLLKPIAAVGGDLVSVSDDGVAVAGALLTDTAPLAHDSAGRPLCRFMSGRYRLRAGEIWLASSHDRRSFDSRYFGPVPVSNILGIARPVLVLR